MADDRTIDAEVRYKAEVQAAELERAVHDMTYMAPSYLARQGLLPGPKKHDPCLKMTRISSEGEETDPSECKRLSVAGAIRLANKVAVEEELLDQMKQKQQQ
jgi:hypothetical protein